MDKSHEMSINYTKGDATNPVGDDKRVIVHVCNDLGKWGKGFVLAISKRWKSPEQKYKTAFLEESKPCLGDVQFILVESNLTVANLIGQHGVKTARSKSALPPIRYEAIEKGLRKVADFAIQNKASVHMPRIGCGLAGGNWQEIEPIINRTLISKDVAVTVYDF